MSIRLNSSKQAHAPELIVNIKFKFILNYFIFGWIKGKIKNNSVAPLREREIFDDPSYKLDINYINYIYIYIKINNNNWFPIEIIKLALLYISKYLKDLNFFLAKSNDFSFAII